MPINFSHSGTAYPGTHARNLGCTSCHKGNSEAVTWSAPAYAPDCAGCHASDYKPSKHQNATVSALRNCAGTCHKSKPEHKVSDRDW